MICQPAATTTPSGRSSVSSAGSGWSRRARSAGPSCRPGAKFCLECGHRLAAPEAQPAPGRRPCRSVAAALPGASRVLHAQAPRREDPDEPLRPRGRAPAGHRAVRRRRRLHAARREARPRGRPPDHEPLLRADHGRGPPLRGHDQPVHRRRGDGALRRPDRPRGRAAAGRARRARDPAGAAGLRQGARRPRAGRELQMRIGINTGPVVVGPDRRRPAHGLHGGRRHDEPGGADAADRPAGQRGGDRGDAQARRRLLRDRSTSAR